MDPLRNRVARELSNATNELNMRKVRINSQVTAMISMFELIGGVIQVFIFVYCKGTTFVAFVYSIILFFILLPYTFLMNSSANRNRIIEYGWKNVLKNVFGKPNVFLQNDNLTIRSETNASKANDNDKVNAAKSRNKVSNKTKSSSTIDLPFHQEASCSSASPNQNPTVKNHVSLNARNFHIEGFQ